MTLATRSALTLLVAVAVTSGVLAQSPASSATKAPKTSASAASPPAASAATATPAATTVLPVPPATAGLPTVPAHDAPVGKKIEPIVPSVARTAPAAGNGATVTALPRARAAKARAAAASAAATGSAPTPAAAAPAAAAATPAGAAPALAAKTPAAASPAGVTTAKAAATSKVARRPAPSGTATTRSSLGGRSIVACPTGRTLSGTGACIARKVPQPLTTRRAAVAPGAAKAVIATGSTPARVATKTTVKAARPVSATPALPAR